MRFFIPLLALFIFAAAPVRAADISDDGAVALKKIVDDSLAYYIATGKTVHQGISLSGPATVTNKSSFYEVTLPGLKIMSNTDVVELGNVVINAKPGKTEQYDTVVNVPAHITVHSVNGDKTTAELNIGDRKFTGEFWPALKTFTKFDADFKNITLKSFDSQPMNVSVDHVTAFLNLNRNDDSTWSGLQKGVVDKLSLSVPNAPNSKDINTLNLGQGSTETSYEHLDLAAVQSLREKTAQLYKNGKTPDSAELKKLMQDSIDKGTTNFLDNMLSNLVLTDAAISYVRPPRTPADAKADSKPVVIKLAKMTSAFDMKGARQEKGSVHLFADIHGFNIDSLPAEQAGLVPNTINIDAGITELPLKNISATFNRLIADAIGFKLPDNATNEEKQLQAQKAQDSANAAADEVMSQLAKAGSTLTIKNTSLTGRDLKSFIDGQIKAKPDATGANKASFNGDVTLALEGIDELLPKYQEKAKTDATLAQPVQLLTLLQMFGRQDKSASTGHAQRVYKLELTPDGRALLNGADVSTFLGMMGQMKGQHK